MEKEKRDNLSIVKSEKDLNGSKIAKEKPEDKKLTVSDAEKEEQEKALLQERLEISSGIARLSLEEELSRQRKDLPSKAATKDYLSIDSAADEELPVNALISVLEQSPYLLGENQSFEYIPLKQDENESFYVATTSTIQEELANADGQSFAPLYRKDDNADQYRF